MSVSPLFQALWDEQGFTEMSPIQEAVYQPLKKRPINSRTGTHGFWENPRVFIAVIRKKLCRAKGYKS